MHLYLYSIISLRIMCTILLFLAIPISASGRNEISQDDEDIPREIRVHYLPELYVERFLHGELTYSGRMYIGIHLGRS